MRLNMLYGKKIAAAVLSVAMTLSTVNGTNIVSFADEVTDSQEQQTEYAGYATGNIEMSEEDIANDKNAISEDEFKSQFDDNITADGDLPAAVDNSATKYFPAIGNQRGIGSCGCWADVYYAYTYARCRAKDISATGDNVMSPAFVYNQIKCSVAGTYSSDVLSMLKMEGTTAFTRADFETYTDNSGCKTWFPTEELWDEASKNRITSYTYLSQPGTISSYNDSDLDQIKTYLKEGNILTYSCDIYGWNYKTLPTSSGTNHGGESIVISAQEGGSSHRMTLVGYDDNVYFDINGDGTIQDAERGAFKIANSWGSSYKNNGFCWISYDALNWESQAGATTTNTRKRAMYSFAMQYINPYAKCNSDVNVVMTLNTSNREQTKVRIKAVDSSNNTYVEYLPATSLNNVLSYALDGSTTATDGTVSYDLNNVVPGLTIGTVANYKWYVIVSDDTNDSESLTLKNAVIKTGSTTILSIQDSVTVNGNTETCEFNKKPEFKITKFTVSKPSPVSVTDSVTLNTEVQGGSGKYQYRYGIICNGTEHSDNFWTTSNVSSIRFGGCDYALVGNLTLFVDVKDTETGMVLRKTIENYVTEGLRMKSFTATTDSGKYKVGNNIHVHVELENEFTYRYNTRLFSCIFNGVEEQFPVTSASTGYDIYYTPKEPGTYTFKYFIRDNGGQTLTDYLTINVKPDINNQTIVYYNNDSWTNANIHYHVDNGEWTNVPGVNMEASDVEGYKWKAVIELDDQEGVDVCFNNGNGDWDSRNSQNYRLGAGTYGIKNGNVETLGFRVTNFTTSVESGNYLDVTYNQRFEAQAAYGSGNYKYRFGVNFKGNEYVTEYSENSSKNIYLTELTGLAEKELAGTYTLFVDAKDTATGQVVRKTIENYVIKTMEIKLSANYENNATVKTGTRIDLHTDYYGAYAIRYATSHYDIYKDGAFYATERGYFDYQYGFYGTWTPSEEGNYEIVAYFSDTWGQTDTDSMYINVRNSNTVKIYYNNNSWSNANIHYQVDNGSWTNVPGVQMQASDRAGYTWMYTIDLNDQNGANVCFNNGNNSWDSRNGSNYRVGKGIYAIQNGNVVALD